MVVVCLLASCGGRLERTARNPAAAVDPDGVEWILVTPPLEEVRIGALRILVNVEGLLGVVDLLRASYEIDLGDEDLLVNLGLDPDLPLVGLGLSEGICLLLPARRGAPVEDILRRVGETSGYRVETEAADKGLLTRVYDDEQRCLVALLSVEGLLLLGYAPDGRADAAVARVALNHLPEDAPGIEVLEGRFLLEWWNSGSGPTRPDVAGWSGPLAGLGHWLHSVKAGVARARLTFKVGLEGINWDLDVVPFETAGEGGTPESADHHYDWKDAVPEDTVLTVQIRDQAEETLGHLLGGKGLYILGLLAGEILGEKKVPALRQALEAMEPQIALVLLGADPRAPVKEVFAPGSVQNALGAIHLGLGVRGPRPAVILDWLPEEDGPVEGGWNARVISKAAPRAVELCKSRKDRSLCLGVIADTDRLMAVSGKGEAERVARVWSGTAPPLAEALFVRKSAGGDVQVTLKLKRLVRDMRAKGVPPFYLRMVNSFLEIQAVRSRTAGSIHYDGEVLLR